jgi:hypothetical protein
MKTIDEAGVLTAEILEAGMKRLLQPNPPPDRFYCSATMLKALQDWQKQEDWLSTLSPHQEKLERLRIRLKNRKPHLPVKLPE